MQLISENKGIYLLFYFYVKVIKSIILFQKISIIIMFIRCCFLENPKVLEDCTCY